MDDLVKKYLNDIEPLTDEARKQMDFFNLALYLQELNQIKELCEFELGDDNNE